MVRRLLGTLVAAVVAVPSRPRRLAAQASRRRSGRRSTAWYRRTADRTGHGEWGVAVGTMDGRVLWSMSPELALIPASTAKVFTTGFTRARVGGDSRHHDPRRRRRHARADRRAAGRAPGRSSWAATGPSTAPAGTGPTLRELARRLRARGVRQLEGPLALTSRTGPASQPLSERLVGRLRGSALRAAGRAGGAAREHHLAHLPAGPGHRRAADPGERLSRRRRPPGPDGGHHGERAAAGGSGSRPNADGGWTLNGTIGLVPADGGLLGGGSRPVAAARRGLGVGARAGRHPLGDAGRAGHAGAAGARRCSRRSSRRRSTAWRWR